MCVTNTKPVVLARLSAVTFNSDVIFVYSQRFRLRAAAVKRERDVVYDDDDDKRVERDGVHVGQTKASRIGERRLFMLRDESHCRLGYWVYLPRAASVWGKDAINN